MLSEQFRCWTISARIADAVAGEIASGQLRPGDRLPPQRDFAYRRGIAASTAARVYAELTRRGLVSGEVGRGTFVRAAVSVPASVLAEPWQAPINLESSFPILPGQPAVLAQGLQALLRPDALGLALRAVPAAGTPAARAVAAAFLAEAGWSPEPARVLFAGNGRQAIAAALSALAPVGGRVGVEALTYPVIKGVAARLGIALVPIAMDAEGLRPDALEAAHHAAPLRGGLSAAGAAQPARHVDAAGPAGGSGGGAAAARPGRDRGPGVTASWPTRRRWRRWRRSMRS